MWNYLTLKGNLGKKDSKPIKTQKFSGTADEGQNLHVTKDLPTAYLIRHWRRSQNKESEKRTESL